MLDSVADYKELLRRAISALPQNNGAARRAVYEKARSALVGQLRAITPPLSARDITQHRLQLEDCIREVEQEASEAVIRLAQNKQSQDGDDLIATLAALMAEENKRAPAADLREVDIDADTVGADLAIERAIEALDQEARSAAAIGDASTGSVDPPAYDESKANIAAGPVSAVKVGRVTVAPQAERPVAIVPPPNAGVPAQSRAVTVFRVTTSGIDVGDRKIFETLLDTPEQREAYESLRVEALTLVAASKNMLGDAEKPLSSFVAALPTDIGDARVFGLWRAGNKLRRLYRAHLAVVNHPDGHPAVLDAAVAEMLGALCDEFNNLAATDPGLRQRDLWRVQPERESAANQEFQSTNRIVEQVVEANIAAPEALAEIAADELPREIQQAPDVVIPEVDLVNQVRRNFFAALIQGAFDYAKRAALAGKSEVAHASRQIADGFYSNVGTGAGIVMMGLVVANNVALRSYAATILNSPQAVAAIDWIVRIFGAAT